jgi:hypothetical protein
MSPYMKDAVERVVATFVVAFLGVLGTALAAGAVKDWQGVLGSAALAGVIAAIDVVKVVLAKFVGDRQSASLVD